MRFRSRRPLTAFSLAELLIVMAIAALLMTLIVPAVNSTLHAIRLTQGTQTILDQLAMARQFAMSKDRVVEMRFYRFADSAINTDDQKYRAVQNFELQDDGSATPLDKLRRLPQGIILDSSPALSPLLGNGRTKQWTTSDPKTSLPGIGTSYDARAVRLRPDGTTDLPLSGQPWFATLHFEHNGDALGSLPDNFALIQIDPWTGQAQLFRP